ncbi:MAG TPA: NAD-dependent epimerase/dehydratase family protein [Gemmatimonadaceae bacterium]
MKILVTGGTGVVGDSVVRMLHEHRHAVRVLTRHAGRDHPWWPSGVDGWAADVSDERTLRGSAEGCDAVVHIAGIAAEEPPDRTFQSVNIDGTRYVVLEAERSGARKLIYISSLGADRGTSAYHKSKVVAEDVVRTFTRDWLVLRPGAVYGPGDAHLSVLLRMVRSLPVIPTIGSGDKKFQPIWHEDLASAIAAAVERDDVRCQSLDLAGTELTSQNDLVQRFSELTGRNVVQAPLPVAVASWGLRALGAVGIDVPFTEDQLDMLSDGNVVPAGSSNALVDVFGITPTTLDDGLRRLVDEQPEQLPSEGTGTLTRKRYWVDVRGSRYDADQLFDHVRAHLADLLPSTVRMKPGPNGDPIVAEGETLTLELPLRGDVQVRVAEAEERRLTLLTVAGHPIAGAVRFQTTPVDDAVRFEVEAYDRPASMIDEVIMRTVGGLLQRSTWIELAQNVVRASGGEGQVQTEEKELSERELEVVNEWARTLSAHLSRNATSSGRD